MLPFFHFRATDPRTVQLGQHLLLQLSHAEPGQHGRAGGDAVLLRPQLPPWRRGPSDQGPCSRAVRDADRRRAWHRPWLHVRETRTVRATGAHRGSRSQGATVQGPQTTGVLALGERRAWASNDCRVRRGDVLRCWGDLLVPHTMTGLPRAVAVPVGRRGFGGEEEAEGGTRVSSLTRVAMNDEQRR